MENGSNFSSSRHANPIILSEVYGCTWRQVTSEILNRILKRSAVLNIHGDGWRGIYSREINFNYRRLDEEIFRTRTLLRNSEREISTFFGARLLRECAFF